MTSEPAHMNPARSFQGLILTLQRYWAEQGCVILQPYDMEMGAGTFHPATTLAGARPRAVERGLCPALAPPEGRPLRREPEPAAALLPVPGHPEAEPAEPAGALSRARSRPSASTPTLHDIRFVEDDWESPTLGAWGLGWECWCDGMEVSQFTYFQQVAGFECSPVAGELTYGLERLAMYLQGVEIDLRPQLQRPRRREEGHLRRCLPAGRAGILRSQLRICRHGGAVPALPRGGGRLPQISGSGRAGRPTTTAISWRCRPTTSASRRATCSTCSTRAA